VAETLIIVPTYDELANLPKILQRIHAAVPDADVLVVDDGSPDGTGALADSMAADDSRLSVLHRPSKGGLGRAYLAGFDSALAAGYDLVVEIDADGSHDPAELPAMIRLAHDGADLVIGSRWTPGGAVHDWPWLRRAISRTGNWYARVMLRSPIHDLTAGFRVYRSTLLRALDLDTVASEGYGFQVEMAWRAERSGFTVVEHPILFVERTEGVSKMHTGIVVEALWRVTLWGVKAWFTPVGKPTRVKA
jgi:dolichol-phosphate mannosyltransferase